MLYAKLEQMHCSMHENKFSNDSLYDHRRHDHLSNNLRGDYAFNHILQETISNVKINLTIDFHKLMRFTRHSS